MKIRYFLSPLVLVSVLVLVRLHQGVLLFHTLAELFSIVVGLLMLVIAWNTRGFTRNDFLVFLGIGYFWIAILDSWHTFTFAGMPFVSADHPEITVRFWVYTRLLEACLLLSAVLFLSRKLNLQWMLYGACGLALATIWVSLKLERPVLLTSEGLTAVKVGMEYLIMAILALSFYVYIRHRNLFAANVLNYLLISIALTICAELFFTLYKDFDGVPFVVGHLFKFLSYWMIYLAIVQTTLTEPFSLMAQRSSSYDAIPDPAIVVDPQGIVSQVNRAAEIFCGREAKEMVHQPAHDFFHDDEIAIEKCDLCRANRQGETIRNRIIKSADDQKWQSVSLAPVDVGDIRSGMVQVFTDITERKQAEVSLRLSEERYRGLVEDIPDLLYRTDNQGRITYVSPSVYSLSGYEMDEAIGMKMAEQVYLHPDRRKALLDELMQVGHIRNFEAQLIRKDGSIWWGSTNAHLLKSEAGETIGVEGIIRDITEQKSAQEHLSFQASHDALTGLFNRREFERRVEYQLKHFDHGDKQHALCFMDLDQFKIVNDTCGHFAGDELLGQLSKLLQDNFRQSDTLARLGGDEFGVLMEHCSLEKAHRVADSLLKQIEKFRFTWEGQQFHIGISIGLVSITENTPSLIELMKQADAACYMAKDLGRNRIHEYHEEDTELAQRQGEMLWVGRINQALRQDLFCLYAQPIITLDNPSELHYELLLRMIGDDGEIIAPGLFLSAAERYNLMGKIDQWVIENAFEWLAANPQFVEQIDFIAVNLSGPSLTDGGFLDKISSQLNRTKINPNKICFEVTETVAISNLNAAISFISILQQFGCRFALDDFGSGLSSFGYLKNLPVDYLKIDGMFVRDMVDDPIAHAMVKSINDIGQVMGMKTIAEFVENDEIREMIKSLGVDYAQGYGIGKPQPLDQLVIQFQRNTIASEGS